jgi:predicted LPLAT superfamily acyltransferase
VSTALVVGALIERVWLAPLIPVTWLVLKLTRTATRIFSARAWDRVLQGNGVSEDERRKLITDAAQRDLKSS